MTHRTTLSKVIVIVLLAFIYILLLAQTFTQQGHIQKLEGNLSDEHMRAMLYDSQLSMQFQYNGFSQKDFSLKDEEGKGHLLSDLLGQENKIVIVFSSLNCASCISSIFYNLDSLREDIDDKDIIVIGQFENTESFMAFKQGHHIPWNLYFLKTTEKDSLGEMLCQPYCCVMSEKLYVKDLYIPLKELPNQFPIYIEAIKEKYGFKGND